MASIFTSIRTFLMADPNIAGIFGGRMQAGRASSSFTTEAASSLVQMKAPYIIFSYVTSKYLMNVPDVVPGNANFDLYNSIIQVSVFGAGHDFTREIGLIVHERIKKRYFSIDGIAVWLHPYRRIFMIDKTRNELGQDIWQSAWQYAIKEPDASMNPNLIVNVFEAFGELIVPQIGTGGVGMVV